jgi:hypothetical protein
MIKVTVRTTFTRLKGLTGGWSKYGGRRFDALDNQSELETKWYCQSCGEEQPALLSPMKVEMGDLGYIRVCDRCYANRLFDKTIQKLGI